MIRTIAVSTLALLGIGLGVAQAQDVNLLPTGGAIKLNVGFAPDPHVIDLLAGGTVTAAAVAGASCLGFVSEAPDLRVFYTAGEAPLAFHVTAEADTALVINGPDGQWLCDDDSGEGLNPSVIINAPLSGQYDIWIGTYSSRDRVAATLAITGANAATALDYTLAPNFGEVQLTAGFTPDPHSVEVLAGGPVDASQADEACRGFTNAAPDYRITYTAGSFPLYIFAPADADITLIISDPNRTWICDDDSGGDLNPQVVFDPPLSGVYDIWVATYSADTPAAATLYISEVSGAPGGAGGEGMNRDLDPLFGTVDLNAGFTPDPFVAEVEAGGPINAEGVGETCNGYVTAAPTYRLFYQPGTFPLIFSVLADGDTTLVIADPNGTWFCGDDTDEDLNPVVTIEAPVPGQYDIWVGTYGPGEPFPATLRISEVAAAGGGGGEGAGTLDWTLPAVHGEVTLNAGFVPDPQTVVVQAGGPISAVDAVNGSCRGYVSAAPHYRLFYTAGSFPLAIWAEGLADITLVISDPNGEWHCDDDSGAGFNFNPAILFQNPLSGQYDIWVGTYAQKAAEATLFISEVTNPIDASGPPVLSGPITLNAIDATLPPAFGEVVLNAGFSPDPHLVAIDAGGPVAADAATGGACAGFVSVAPAYRFTYNAAGRPLFLAALSEADTTLMVRTPNGDWLCDDDGGEGLNPLIRLDQPMSGRYDIWVGTFTSDVPQAATVHISEIGGP